ncbi:MAG: prolyl oligopeptidase family serine peptidase [Firmicutes bacterium]|nr:prolyl oligopeptidase family serine peptidase [Bacillota bacterium]
MKKKITAVIFAAVFAVNLCACGPSVFTYGTETKNTVSAEKSDEDTVGQADNMKKGGAMGKESEMTQYYTRTTKISEVMEDAALGDYGRLLFPVNTGYYRGHTLEDLYLTWYNYIDPDKTVEICNYMKNHALAGETVFYDIYSDAEKEADPAKKDTGLFFFKGNPGAKFAVVNAGGGMVYVGAMHDSFPQALELSKKGYNAFALIYKPGTQTACKDLARAISFIFENAEELEIDTSDYSLWGGSAGARMAAWLGSYGTAAYGEKEYPAPGAVIMQYTGLSEVNGNEPPTYNCVGTFDSIADYEIMERRIEQIKANGTDARIDVFYGLPHGFGLGTGTGAEGWLDNAVAFWESNMRSPAAEKSDISIDDFAMDNVIDGQEGRIHYNIYVPLDYSEKKTYSLYIAMPGWEGLYFQGAGTDLRSEFLPFEAVKYRDDLIIVSPQFEDWGEKSAKQAVELTRYMLETYSIDPSNVFISGYSGGGETLSVVLSMHPELYRAALFISSQWDGDYETVAEAKIPLYLFTSEHDSYYGAEPVIKAYEGIREAYHRQGLSNDEIDDLLVLDIREDSWFDAEMKSSGEKPHGMYASDYHGAGMLAAFDKNVMGWFFGR